MGGCRTSKDGLPLISPYKHEPLSGYHAVNVTLVVVTKEDEPPKVTEKTASVEATRFTQKRQ